MWPAGAAKAAPPSAADALPVVANPASMPPLSTLPSPSQIVLFKVRRRVAGLHGWRGKALTPSPAQGVDGIAQVLEISPPSYTPEVSDYKVRPPTPLRFAGASVLTLWFLLVHLRLVPAQVARVVAVDAATQRITVQMAPPPRAAGLGMGRFELAPDEDEADADETAAAAAGAALVAAEYDVRSLIDLRLYNPNL